LTEDNLASMTRDAKAAGSRVLLVGMQVPPNYGAQYTRDFAAVVPRVAKAQGASVVPFFLKGFADQPDAQRWFQADRIHPNEDAQPRMLDNVWPELRKLL
jgi:acyl-CoA thioesterase-1